VDTTQGRIVADEEIKTELAAEQPYQEWLDKGIVPLEDLPQGNYSRMPHHDSSCDSWLSVTPTRKSTCWWRDGSYRRRAARIDGH